MTKHPVIQASPLLAFGGPYVISHDVPLNSVFTLFVGLFVSHTLYLQPVRKVWRNWEMIQKSAGIQGRENATSWRLDRL